jgi:hypothetical protein
VEQKARATRIWHSRAPTGGPRLPAPGRAKSRPVAALTRHEGRQHAPTTRPPRAHDVAAATDGARPRGANGAGQRAHEGRARRGNSPAAPAGGARRRAAPRWSTAAVGRGGRGGGSGGEGGRPGRA